MTAMREPGSPPLHGLRVVELGGEIAAAYATKLLRDLGADVVKIEPPKGDPMRAYGPVPANASARGGGLFQYLNSGKRSIVLDSAKHADHARLVAVLSRTDILVESLGAGALECAWGTLDAEQIAPVVVRISPFGQTGPYRDRAATSLIVQAAGGWVARIGTPEGPPYFVGTRIEEYVAGAYAAASALTGLRHAHGRNEHVLVDVSTFECMVATVPYPMLQKITFDRLGFPVPQRYQPIPGILRCADGFVGISALTGQHWTDVCAILELPELAEKMREVTLRGAEWKAFLAKAQPWLLTRTCRETVDLFQALRVPAVPISDGGNLKGLEPFVSREFFIAQPEAGFGRPRSPFRLSVAPAPQPGVAPRLGEHTHEISSTAAGANARAAEHNDDSDGQRPASRATMPPPGLTPSARAWGGGRTGLPFSGLRVLDFTTFWAGPYLTMYLASMGADVVKIESPRRPDGFRFVAAFPQLGARWWEQSPVYHATNLGKRDVAIDLDRDEGRALVRRLAAEADVIAENFSPRVMEHFGLGYDVLRVLNPGAIVLRMPGFGLEGPCRDWVGWALTFEQMGGLANVTGEPRGRMFAPGGFADPVVGMHAAVALQAALSHREKTGEGQQIEVAQIEVVAAMAAEQVIRHELTSEIVARDGNRSATFVPQGVYRAAGRDEWVAISVRNTLEWHALCNVIGSEAGARLDDAEARRHEHDAVDARIAAWSAVRAAEQAAEQLRAAGVPAAALLSTDGMYHDPQLEARSFFEELDHPICGRLRYPGWPMHFSFGPAPVHGGPAPTLGQHGTQVLREVLGLNAVEIEALSSTGVVGDKME
jgi:crotonobetainyl-CoA:carnitine CoA-transferase CaiB-like acyl-CoA transferase